MPDHKHTVRNDMAYEILQALTELGEEKIPTAMTFPHARFRRKMRYHCEQIDDAQQTLRDNFTEWKIDAKTSEVEKDEKGRRVPAPVYLRNDDGSPKFKLDADGNPTKERELAHGKIQLTDVIAHDRAVKELMREEHEITVPHLSWPQIEGKIKLLKPNLVEAIMDFVDGAPGSEDKKPQAKGKKE